MEKPTLEELREHFKLAEDRANQSSDDAEKKVGANVLGYTHTAANTFVHKATNLPNTRPDKYEYIIHAEANLVFWAAREGFILKDEIVICTLSPCQNCIRTLFQAGVREIYYSELYRNHDIEMQDIKVTETPYGEFTHMKLENYD